MILNSAKLDKFIKKQEKYCVNFLNDPTEFIKKVIIFATKGKNHTDLAQNLKIPESLVRSLIYVVKNYQLEKQCKSFESLLLSLTDAEQLYKSFIKPTPRPNGIIINLWTDSDVSWFDNDAFCIFYPVKPEPRYDLPLNVYGETWELNLKYITGNKHNVVTAKNMKEKREILKMTELMIKYNI